MLYGTSELRWILNKLENNPYPSVDGGTFAEYLPHRTAEQVEFLWQGVEDVIRERLSEDWMVPVGDIPILKPVLLIRDAKHQKWMPFRKKVDQHRLAPRQWAMRFDQAIFANLDQNAVIEIMEQVMSWQRYTVATLLRSPVTFTSSAEFSYRDRLVRKRECERNTVASAKPIKRSRKMEEPRGVKSPPAAAVAATAAAATPPTTVAANTASAAELPKLVTPDVPTTKRHQKSASEIQEVFGTETATKRSLFVSQTRDDVSAYPLENDNEGETTETHVAQASLATMHSAPWSDDQEEEAKAEGNHAYFPSKFNITGSSETESKVVEDANESSHESETGIEESSSREEPIQTMVV